MKKLILIISLVLPFLANGQDYRVVDWKTDVLNVQTVGIDTFKFDAEPKDYNDAGAITREIGNYFIDYVARCFKIIDSDATTITVVDLEHINSAPQSNQIGRVYQSVVDADSLFQSIGGVDISVLDQMSIYRDVARNNEIICRILKELYLKDATYRQKTDHDSLSMLDEKSYNSLTDKPDLSSYRQKSDHDSLSALDEKSYNSLTDKPTSLPASDVSAWAKAATKPTYTKSEVGLGNVDNTSDASKPISTATQTALNNLVPYTGAISDLDMGANSVSADTFKIDNTPLLLNTFKEGNLGGAGDIFYSTGASSQPASGSLNQVIGGNLLNPNVVVKWDGSKFADSWINQNPIDLTIGNGNDFKTIINSGGFWEVLEAKGTGQYASFLLTKTGVGTGFMTYDGSSFQLSAGTHPYHRGDFNILNSGLIGINTTDPSERLDVNGNLIADVLKSRVATGIPPLVVASTTKVDNLNAELLDGKHASDFASTIQLADSTAAIRALANTKASISGTDNYIMKKTGANTLGNSIIYESEGKIGVATTTPRAFFDVPLTSVIGNTEIRPDGGIIINNRGTGNRYAFIDFKGDSVYQSPLRIIRYNTGKDANSDIAHRGTGDFRIITQEAANIKLFTSTVERMRITPTGNVGVGTSTPAARVHSESTTTPQLTLGYNSTSKTTFTTGSTGNLTIVPSGGFTDFSGGISASAFSTFTGQVEMTGLDVNLGASTVLRKNGSDIFTAPITMGACGSAGQVLTSTGLNSAPTWTTPATGSGSGITSIGMQVPTGLTVSPASLTANGTFTIGLQSGYSIPTTAKQSQWDAGYTYRLTSASGTSPLTLSLSNNALTGSLNSTLTNIGNTSPSTGYLYYNGSSYSYQAATTTYTLPTASSSTLGGVKINGNGMAINAGGVLFQEDNNLTTRTPEVSDYIAFYDNSATAQGKMTLSTLGSLIGGSGGSTTWPATAGIAVYSGSGTWSTSKAAPSGAIVGTTDNQALTNKSVNGVTLSTFEGPTRFLRGDGTYERINVVQTLTSAPSITMNIWNGSKAVLALATNSTITITNVPNGGEGSIEVTNSGTYTLAIAGSTGYTTTQKMGTVAAIASSAHTTVFYWRSGTVLYYGFLLNN